MQGKKTFDTSLQDVVYTLDVGAGLKILRTSLYVVMLLVIILIYTATQFWGLKSDEAMYYGQLGRNFSAENGWVTKSVTPFSMSQIEEVTPARIRELSYIQSSFMHRHIPWFSRFSSACLRRQARNLF